MAASWTNVNSPSQVTIIVQERPMMLNKPKFRYRGVRLLSNHGRPKPTLSCCFFPSMAISWSSRFSKSSSTMLTWPETVDANLSSMTIILDVSLNLTGTPLDFIKHEENGINGVLKDYGIICFPITRSLNAMHAPRCYMTIPCYLREVTLLRWSLDMLGTLCVWS